MADVLEVILKHQSRHMIQRLIFSLLLTLLAFGGFAQKQAKANTEVLELKETTHDFGSIPQGRPVTYDFIIRNAGKTPLKLDNVMASCGCTSPEWSEAPIQAGAASVVKVGFNAAAEGRFSKNITISYGGSNTKVLVITGEVFSTPTTSAPVNASLSAIKQINQ
jgi:hypothetical protein